MKAMLGIIALFSTLVGCALYFLLGGPVPQAITWEGEIGTAFEGRYLISDDIPTNFRSTQLSRAGESFTTQYPHTVRFWAPRNADVLASATILGEQNVQNSIQIRRVGVPCVEAYRWGTSITAECED